MTQFRDFRLTCVLEVRRILEQYVKDEYNRVMAEREAARQSRPEPELPPKVLEYYELQ